VAIGVANLHVKSGEILLEDTQSWQGLHVDAGGNIVKSSGKSWRENAPPQSRAVKQKICSDSRAGKYWGPWEQAQQSCNGKKKKKVGKGKGKYLIKRVMGSSKEMGRSSHGQRNIRDHSGYKKGYLRLSLAETADKKPLTYNGPSSPGKSRKGGVRERCHSHHSRIGDNRVK